MAKLKHLFLFLFFFQAEVHVRAAGDVLQTPEACLMRHGSCAIHVVGQAYHYIKNGVNIHASSGSTVVRNSSNNWNFVTGVVWVEEGEGLEFQSVYGKFKTEFGQYWLIDQKDRLLVRNMSADLKITLRDGKVLELPEGFEFWISGLNSKGVSEYGVIKPIEMKSHIALWGSIYNGNKKAFRKELMRLKDRWGDLPEKSGQIYRALVDRQVASDQERQVLQEKEAARKRAAQQKIKNIYFERVFER